MTRHGTYSSKESILAGLDLEMPGPTPYQPAGAKREIASGRISHHDIDKPFRNVLKFVKRAMVANVSATEGERNLAEDRTLNRRLAGESIVLLKNDDNILPLPEEDGDIAVIGPNAAEAAMFGGGSASLRPYYAVSPLQGLTNNSGNRGKVYYETGVNGHRLLPLFGVDNVFDIHGKPGVTMHVYVDPWTSKERKTIDIFHIDTTEYQLMDYIAGGIDPFYVTMTCTFVPSQSGTFEFGLAVYGTADLFINDEVVIDNSTIQRQGDNFFGKGTEEERQSYQLIAGKSYKLRVEFGSASTAKIEGRGTIAFAGGAARVGGCLKLSKEEGIARAVALAKRCKTTIVVAGLNVSPSADSSIICHALRALLRIDLYQIPFEIYETSLSTNKRTITERLGN